jgi:hypothetical protein
MMSRTVLVDEVSWPHTLVDAKDPGATLDYTLDWSGWLDGDEEITAVDVEADSSVTVDEESFTGTTATAWVSGGAAGRINNVKFTVTTDSTPVNRIDVRTLRLRIKQQ